MGKVISYIGRKIKAKGVNPDNTINEQKLKEYLFDDEYENIKLLDNVPKIFLSSDKPILFYPGCGADILFPLLYFEKLFPKIQKARFLFVDKSNNLGLIKTILDDIGICFAEKGNWIMFCWKNNIIELEFITGDIFALLETIPGYDIYFERAFRIIKERHVEYEKNVFTKLREGGILISDSGFQQVLLKEFPVPQELSSYHEMVFGQK